MSPSLHESTITTFSHCHALLGHLMVHYANTEVSLEDLTQARQALTTLGGTLAALVRSISARYTVCEEGDNDARVQPTGH